MFSRCAGIASKIAIDPIEGGDPGHHQLLRSDACPFLNTLAYRSWATDDAEVRVSPQPLRGSWRRRPLK
jgi:hypothetical protein